MPAQITTDQVWKALEKEIFGVLGMVTAKGESRTVGIVYAVHAGKLLFTTDRTAWKTRHVRKNPEISMTVPIAKRLPFVPWIKIPPATITFSGRARVLELEDAPRAVLEKLTKGLEGTEELERTACVVEVTPKGDFITYGVGVSLQTMRNPVKAGGRVSVA